MRPYSRHLRNNACSTSSRPAPQPSAKLSDLAVMTARGPDSQDHPLMQGARGVPPGRCIPHRRLHGTKPCGPAQVRSPHAVAIRTGACCVSSQMHQPSQTGVLLLQKVSSTKNMCGQKMLPDTCDGVPRRLKCTVHELFCSAAEIVALLAGDPAALQDRRIRPFRIPAGGGKRTRVGVCPASWLWSCLESRHRLQVLSRWRASCGAAWCPSSAEEPEVE